LGTKIRKLEEREREIPLTEAKTVGERWRRF